MNSASCRLIHVQALNACPPGPDGPRIRIQGWTLSAHATARPKIGSCPVCACWRENAATCCVRLKLLFPCLIAREANNTETVSERGQCRIGNEEHQIPKGLTWIARGFNPVLKRVDLKSATGKLNRSAGFFGRRSSLGGVICRPIKSLFWPYLFCFKVFFDLLSIHVCGVGRIFFLNRPECFHSIKSFLLLLICLRFHILYRLATGSHAFDSQPLNLRNYSLLCDKRSQYA